MVHTCAYDSWAAYDAVAVGTRLGGSLRRPPAERTEANKAEAVSFAACQAALDHRHAEGPNQLGGYADTTGRADRPAEGDLRVLGRRAQQRDAARAMVPARAGRLRTFTAIRFLYRGQQIPTWTGG
ncbi:DUF6851 domain-containing protein [Nonomuraea sp. 3N208]|uniref:DUF6851 domain-containing protein n=1 Tax=Nonomuraea sp. 3N208 TaxID=3457421 RepID=UPI003FCD8DC6